MSSYADTLSSAVRPSNALRGVSQERVGIGYALVDNCTSEQVCESLIDHAFNNGSPAFVITPNAQHICLLNKDEKFRHIYNQADLVIPDGISLLLAARVFGRNLQERVAGVEMFQDLCRDAAAKNLHVFLLGGRPGSADLAASMLRRSLPQLRCTTFCPPYGFEQTEQGLQMVAEAIESAKPHLLFVGLGAPKQEYWIHDHGLKLGVPVQVGIGGSFEMVGGVIQRAPVWIQKIACEWLYRVCREPRRLWRRYLIGNAVFAEIVLRQRLRRMLLNACLRVANKNGFAAELDELSLQQSQATEYGRADSPNQKGTMVQMLEQATPERQMPAQPLS